MHQDHAASHRIAARAAAAKEWLDSPPGKRVQKWISFGLSILILLLLARSIAGLGWQQVVAALPWNPLFWLLFTASYLMLPLVDFIIYRRWWPLTWHDLGLFLKMRVMNEALFSYSGHTYLLVRVTSMLGIAYDPNAPAKRILGRGNTAGLDPRTSPLAAVKDMAITSGLAGNFTTLVMLLLAIALGGGGVITSAMDPRTVSILLWSFGAMIALNLGIILFRNRVMSIPTGENLRAFWWHLFRVNVQHFLFIGSWVVALPMIPFATWFLLGALRMVIQRMPVPNKEVLFAAIAVQLAGEASVDVAALMAAQGALYLIFHVLAWVVASVIEDRKPGQGVR